MYDLLTLRPCIVGYVSTVTDELPVHDELRPLLGEGLDKPSDVTAGVVDSDLVQTASATSTSTLTLSRIIAAL